MTAFIPSLAIVIPCYNEEEMLPKTLATMLALRDGMIARGKINDKSKIYLVDDGSKDKTWEILAREAAQNSALVGVKLSRNKGHQNALYAGLCTTTEDITVSIDADLQDDPQNIEAMVDEYLKGNDVVYGVRSARNTDTFFKRFTAEGYYHLMKKMGVDLVFNHADFRLLSRRALESLKEYDESNLFLRGIVREVGYPSSVVEYERQAREAGESKYPLKKMLSFAWKGITAFSTAPLRMITVLGLVSGFASFTLIAWVLAIRFFTDNATPGWASVLLPLLFIGSVQLLCLGVIGEYLSKIYEEVKRRPKFHISEIIKKD
ncbi:MULTISPECIES: glycosyltransferase family 2 protein [unclassified Cellvibrio]|jgi:glycosyltransferase involved in cell wall biosynthesis|uniref:glycosyltransferase family 2 protein n=1 Tax=unclassified Cellvibrio TaxID=2624793 RepID=UPI00058BE59F|nr:MULTISPECIES: glycosyltransferase family 2 protein [unclassified Cellvibrio]QEY13555.1 glycosyltransferase [Cellvibrio sp. KY-YJ-3]UUA73039.1 glycosyltransferase family 2 protein [Cellvibrio sp. QJXJ]